VKGCSHAELVQHDVVTVVPALVVPLSAVGSGASDDQGEVDRLPSRNADACTSNYDSRSFNHYLVSADVRLVVDGPVPEVRSFHPAEHAINITNAGRDRLPISASTALISTATDQSVSLATGGTNTRRGLARHGGRSRRERPCDRPASPNPDRAWTTPLPRPSGIPRVAQRRVVSRGSH